jgi:hypothetical protein
MTISSRTLAALALTLLVSGCGGAASVDEEQLAADGTQAMMSSQQSTHLANLVFEVVTESDPVKAAAQIAGPATAPWSMGCAKRTRDTDDPSVARVTYKNCTGPFGLAHLDGDEVITFSAGADGGVHAAITGDNLTANGHPVTYTATADITVTGTLRRVVWQGTWTRVDALGSTVAHTSDLNLDVDTGAGCRIANGTAKTTVGAREVDTTISDYAVCRNAGGEDACPSGTVTHTRRVSGRSLTIEFDTSDTAEATGPLGHTFAVSLACPAADRAPGT